MTSLASWMRANSIGNLLVDLVARVPLSVQAKLLLAFLTIAGLLIVLGAVGLQVLGGVNEQTNELIKLQRKIAAYRQVQHDTTIQLNGISTALLFPDDRTLDDALRQLNQFGYDFDRLEFVAKDEAELVGQVRREYGRFMDVVTHVVELIRDGRLGEAREVQLTQSASLADRLERLMSQLVNIAEADIVAAIDATDRAYRASRYIVIAFALGSIVLAIGLGYVISLSLIKPIMEIEAGLRQIAAGDFTQRIRIVNRDELSRLADHVNRTSEELGRLYHRVEEASQHKSAFLATMSHELRTPMNAIIGFTRLVMRRGKDVLPVKQYENLEKILISAQNLLALINDILDLSKIEAGRIEIRADKFELKPLIDECLNTVEPLINHEHVSLETDLVPDLPPVFADPDKLRQVLINLLSNALKFTDRGRIVVTARGVGGHVTIAVADSGIGIPSDALDMVFEEFRQVDVGATGKIRGTGLGLPISRRLARLMDGDITVESEIGKGSTFTVTVPRADKRPEQIHGSP